LITAAGEQLADSGRRSGATEIAMGRPVYLAVFASFLGILLAAQPAAAGSVSAGAAASTLGFGAEAGYRFGPRIGVRVAGYTYDYDNDGVREGVDYDYTLELGAIGAYVDWHPLGGALRISAGWFANDTGISATGRPQAGGNYDIGGTTFTSADVGTLSGSLDMESSAPYLGAGWQFGGGDGGLSFSVDVGVLFQDPGPVRLTSTGGSLSGSPSLNAALAQETAELQNDVDDLDLYPVVTLGVQWGF
jgi:hypothetical protein